MVATMPHVFTARSALVEVNRELVSNGEPVISLSTLHTYGKLYGEKFPTAPWIVNKRLCYGMPVVLFILLTARIQKRMRNMNITKQMLTLTLEEMKERNVGFSERFKTFSDVHSFVGEFPFSA